MTHRAFFLGHDVGVFAAVNKVDFRMFYGMSSAANNIIANLVTR